MLHAPPPQPMPPPLLLPPLLLPLLLLPLLLLPLLLLPLLLLPLLLLLLTVPTTLTVHALAALPLPPQLMLLHLPPQLMLLPLLHRRCCRTCTQAMRLPHPPFKCAMLSLTSMLVP
jgi:hypothetical protein